MNLLLLGSGGRERALAWRLSKRSTLECLYIAPGHAGTREYGDNISIDPCELEAVKKIVLDVKIKMVVVGPEAHLVAGIADFFKADKTIAHVGVIGPNKEASQLEGSKDLAKDVMNRHNIPTAKHTTFTKDTTKEGFAFLDSLKAP